MSMFIKCEVDEPAASDQDVAKKLASVCPVDIFAVDGNGRVRIVEENEDECILCGLCLEAAPDGAVRVIKLYDNNTLLRKA